MKKVIPLLLCLFLAVPACGGRVPKDAKTSHLAKKYFHKYGKKYKETVFYKNPVQTVEVKGTQELQRNLATSFLVMRMSDGQDVPVILTMLRKFPAGWRITGWEIFRRE